MKTIAALLLVCLCGCGLNTSPGNGEKIGTIVKLKKVGMMSKTWEAELIRGGMNNGSGSFSPTPLDFTIETEEDAARIKKFMEDQTEVLVKYRQEGCYSINRTESGGTFLVSIEPAKK